MNTIHTVVDSTLGELTLVSDGESLTGVNFAHHWTRPSPATFGQRIHHEALLIDVASQLTKYLTSEQTSFDLAITTNGDDLQNRVWQLLTEIPYGETVTYGELAARLGATTAQEVGQAVGRNPLSIVVPCTASSAGTEN